MKATCAKGIFCGGSMKGDVNVHFFTDSNGDLFASVSFFVGEGRSGKSDAVIILEARCNFDKDTAKGISRGDSDVFLKAAELTLEKIAVSDPGSKFGELMLIKDFAFASAGVDKRC